jgi:hypothetical protein
MSAAGKIGIKLITIAIGIPVSIATRKLVEAGWNAARPENPPRKPSEEGVRWVDAIAWGVVSAAGVVVADLITRRSAEVTFRAITGNEPPPGKQDKEQQNAEVSAS